jgi:transcriptional regulator of met regulon
MIIYAVVSRSIVRKSICGLVWVFHEASEQVKKKAIISVFFSYLQTFTGLRTLKHITKLNNTLSEVLAEFFLA